jgi:hypothetical protein
MTTLSSNDFTKPSSGGEFSGMDRIDIVHKKIKSGRPFIIGKDGKGDVIYGMPLERGAKWIFEMRYSKTPPPFSPNQEPDGTVKSTQIFKDSDLGGGTGSGGGATKTAIVESLQCYYLTMLYNSNLTKLPPFNDSKQWGSAFTNYGYLNVSKKNDIYKNDKDKLSPLYDYEDNCTTTKNLTECLDNDPWGADVYIKIANAIYKSVAGKKFSKPVYVHRGSKFMDEVYARKKRCLDHDKRLAKQNGIDPVAPASFSNDKWNPGDIWMTTQTDNTPFPHYLNEGELGEHTCDWGALKDVVRESAESGMTLGISLKKVEGQAKVAEYNTKERTKNITRRWGGFTFGRKGEFFSSADMYVTFSGDDIQFRSTATTSSWQGEIKGGAASGGKIGGGGVQYYVEKHIGKNVSIGNSSAGHNWKETTKISDNRAWELYEKFNEKQKNYKNLLNTSEKVVFADQNKKKPKGKMNGVKTLSKEEFLSKWKSADAGLRFSKGMNLEFLDSVHTGGGKLKGGIPKFAEDVFRYAASNTDYSSFYIKVS